MPEARRFLSLGVLLALSFVFAAGAATKSLPQLPAVPRAAPSGDEEAAIVRAMNSVRSAYGLPPLRVGRALRRAARSHSADMVRRGYFDHGPFARRLRRFGVRARIMGENLAYGTELTASECVQMWMASPEHRANVLERGFRRIGVGVAGGDTRLVTADFAGS